MAKCILSGSLLINNPRDLKAGIKHILKRTDWYDVGLNALTATTTRTNAQIQYNIEGEELEIKRFYAFFTKSCGKSKKFREVGYTSFVFVDA